MSTPGSSSLIYPHGYEEAEGSEPLGQMSPIIDNTMKAVETYAREKPWNFAMWALGIGFVLGWKLKI